MASGPSGRPSGGGSAAAAARRRGWKRSRSTPSADAYHPLDTLALELARHELGRRERRLDQPAQPADVVPGELPPCRAHRPGALGPGRDDPGEVAVVEPDRRQVEPPGGEMDQPGREPGAADLDQVGPLVRHDPAGRAGGQHEAVGLLGGNRGTVEPVAADAARSPGSRPAPPGPRSPGAARAGLLHSGPSAAGRSEPRRWSRRRTRRCRARRARPGRRRAGRARREMSSAARRVEPANDSRSGSVQTRGASVRAVPERVDGAAVRAGILAAPGAARDLEAAAIARRGQRATPAGR